MIYKVDGIDVNTRPDWRQRLLPAPSSQRIETFPGVEELFAIDGPQVPASYVITGFLEFTGVDGDEAASNLLADADVWDGVRNSGLVHTLQLYDRIYLHAKLVRFEILGELTRADRGGVGWVRQPCMFVWQLLTNWVQDAA